MEFKESSQKKDLQRVYRSSIFHCIVRKVGWILVFIGALIILIYWGYKIVGDLVLDFSITFLLKIGVLIVIGGLIILLVSLIIYQLFLYKRESYEERQRFKMKIENQS
jgi:hypothetical protein